MDLRKGEFGVKKVVVVVLLLFILGEVPRVF